MSEVAPCFKPAKRVRAKRDTADLRHRARAQAGGKCQAVGLHALDCPLDDAWQDDLFQAHHVRPTRPDWCDDSTGNLLWLYAPCHLLVHKWAKLARVLGLLDLTKPPPRLWASDVRDPLHGLGVDRALEEGWITVDNLPPL